MLLGEKEPAECAASMEKISNQCEEEVVCTSEAAIM